jgi:protein SCO1/2
VGRRTFIALTAAALLAACGEQGFKSTDVTGADFAKDFELTDQNGQVRRLGDFKGKAVLVFFGFTQCPDICPTTLARMLEVKKALGPQGDKLQVIFVTVDPERDTPELLKNYMAAFDPAFLGLRPTPEQLPAVAKSFKVFYQKVPGKTPGTYTMDHSAVTYVYDPQGRLRLAVMHNQDAASIAEDLKKLLG